MAESRSIPFQLREALEGIHRTGVMNLATVTTVALSLSILGGFLLGLRNLNLMLDGLQSVYEVTVFLDQGADESIRKLLLQNLDIDPSVAQVTFVPKEKALDQLEADLLASGQVMPQLERNPLPDAYRILVREGSDFHSFRTRLKSYPGVHEISSGQEWVAKVLALVKLARAVGLLLVLILGGASLLIISNTISLTVHSRRDEIEIMQLVGATDWFIRVPFLIEGFLQGVTGGLAAVALIFLGYSFLVREIHSIAPFLPLITSTGELVRLSVQLVLMGVILGLLGALLSLRKILV
jgi:cell division transport system permease protein